MAYIPQVCACNTWPAVCCGMCMMMLLTSTFFFPGSATMHLSQQGSLYWTRFILHVLPWLHVWLHVTKTSPAGTYAGGRWSRYASYS